MSIGGTGTFPAISSPTGRRQQRPAPGRLLGRLLVTAGRRCAAGLAAWNADAILLLLVLSCSLVRAPFAGLSIPMEANESDGLSFGRELFPAQSVARSQDPRTFRDNPWFPPASPSLGRPGDLIRALPPGRVLEVKVKGQLATRLPDRDYGLWRRWDLVYAFEASYRRTIESNDGYRVVERRDYGEVRGAKLLLAVDDPEVLPATVDRWTLENLAFPLPNEGIFLMPAGHLASRLLSRESRPLADHHKSRGYLESDPLSGKSVRFVYRDGIGLELVEAIGWQPTNQAMAQLASRAVPVEWLALAAEAAPDDGQRVDHAVLSEFLPGVIIRGSGSTSGNVMVESKRAVASLDDLLVDSRKSESKAFRVTLDYDPCSHQVPSAELECSSISLLENSYHLLHESLSDTDASMTVRYECKVQRDAPAGSLPGSAWVLASGERSDVCQ